MRKELKNIAEYKKPSNATFAVVRSFGEANNEGACRRVSWARG